MEVTELCFGFSLVLFILALYSKTSTLQFTYLIMRGLSAWSYIEFLCRLPTDTGLGVGVTPIRPIRGYSLQVFIADTPPIGSTCSWPYSCDWTGLLVPFAQIMTSLPIYTGRLAMKEGPDNLSALR